MAKAPNVQIHTPSEDDGKKNRFSISIGSLKIEAVGEFLNRPWAWPGLALIVSSVIGVLALLGVKLWPF